MLERQLTEHEEQRDFVQWFRKKFLTVRILAIPNGGARNIITASAMKLEGVSPGVPDLYVPAWGLWIEMKKAKNGVVSDAQKDWISYLLGLQYSVFVAKGCEDAKLKVIDFLRERKL